MKFAKPVVHTWGNATLTRRFTMLLPGTIQMTKPVALAGAQVLAHFLPSGTIRIGDQVVNQVAPRDRDIAMVFQSYALYPQMSVAQNIGFALRMKKLPKVEIDRRVREAAKILGITDWLNRKPSQLSGGQRQRVAMGRAIVREPSVFLMDEPLSNLDAKLRVQMRAEVSRVQCRIGVATLYVTHDQTEAMTLGHRVAVLRAGELQQCDAPQVLYDRPRNLFVAGFIGSPAMNLLKAGLSEDLLTLTVGSQQLPVSANVLDSHPGLRKYHGKTVIVGVRPEDFRAATGERLGAEFRGDVELVEALGSELLVHFTTDAPIIQSERSQEIEESGEEGSVSTNTCVAKIEPRHAEFFDLDTEQAIWT